MWLPRFRRGFTLLLCLVLLAVPRIAGTAHSRINWETVIADAMVAFSITWVMLWVYAWVEEMATPALEPGPYLIVDPSVDLRKFQLVDKSD